LECPFCVNSTGGAWGGVGSVVRTATHITILILQLTSLFNLTFFFERAINFKSLIIGQNCVLSVCLSVELICFYFSWNYKHSAQTEYLQWRNYARLFWLFAASVQVICELSVER
jgi:hypothetical protein